MRRKIQTSKTKNLPKSPRKKAWLRRLATQKSIVDTKIKKFKSPESNSSLNKTRKLDKK